MGSYTSKNKLSVEDMTFLQAKTQLDQASIQGWYEGFLKDCPSGELTKEQFVEMYSKIFPSGNADNFSKNIFRTFDTNNSGELDFTEFVRGLAMFTTKNVDRDKKLEFLFNIYDMDRDGFICNSELFEVEEKWHYITI